MINKIDVSIVVPVYKSTKSLEILSEQIQCLQNEMQKHIELIFVNDSPFFLDSCKTLKALDQKYDFVKAITLRKNQGQHMALLVGIKEAQGEYVITMDDDLQHPVSELPKLINAISNQEDVDVIFAVPSYKDKKHNLIRNLGSYAINKIDSAFLQKPKGLVKSPFRIMKADLAKVVVKNYNSSPAVSSLIIKATDNIVNIEVEHNNREYGSSGYSLGSLIRLTMNNVIHYSSLPLKIMGYIGLLGFLFSVCFIATVVIRKLFLDISFPGYTSIVSLISFFGGLNLLAVGVMGEYLIRIVKEQQKPSLENLYK